MRAVGLKWFTGTLLALASTICFAEVGALYDATLEQRPDIDDPAVAASTIQQGWFAFSVPQLQTQRSPCCWKGKWNHNGVNDGEVGCELKKSHQSYGTRNDSPIEEQIIVYHQIMGDEVVSTLVAGQSCPVDAGGAAVTWIGDVDEQAGLDWLLASAKHDDASLYALGLHASNAATAQLVSMAVASDDEDLSEQAIFWLGEARGQSGFIALKALLDELPIGDIRQHINFALAQNHSSDAADLLVEISKTDKDEEQRSNALFWLAEEFPQRAAPVLLEFVRGDHSEDALEEAVFAISQLGDNTGDQILMGLARDKDVSRVIRRQALFWLAQSDNDDTVEQLAQLLSQ